MSSNEKQNKIREVKLYAESIDEDNERLYVEIKRDGKMIRLEAF